MCSVEEQLLLQQVLEAEDSVHYSEAIHLLELTATNSGDRTHPIYPQQFIHSISANWSTGSEGFYQYN